MQQASDFQRKKFLRVFSTFFDLNNDGYIEWRDFELLIERIRMENSWDVDGECHQAAIAAMESVWRGLKRSADTNKDSVVTEGEWCRMWTDQLPQNSKSNELQEWQVKYLDFMFETNDTSGDGLIDKEEYITAQMAYGLSRQNCEEAFDLISKDGAIDRKLFQRLWVEYFTSDDLNTTGNYLFGKLCEDDDEEDEEK